MPQRVALTNQGYYSIFPQGDRGPVGKPGLPGPQVSLKGNYKVVNYSSIILLTFPFWVFLVRAHLEKLAKLEVMAKMELR